MILNDDNFLNKQKLKAYFDANAEQLESIYDKSNEIHSQI
ncbi:hypothetical protein OTSGILL_2542 [Orientia tsutsugamushi str. Gilliam]|uniref:Uncharacterized protein n=1 Tax=Orientia tsutsugamushi str. Gilliam TaxID=1359184 RepID=A0A0F3M6H6_ORITS|nr:hypothetical protein OTSGILL_2542 [Orientia tsutsugamushi str. Gilliam]